jgi:hypothetical protein
MEACLTLTRSFYFNEEKTIKQFVEVHPTEDKTRLTNKILARIMTKCTKEITEEQLAILLPYKNTPTELKFKPHEDLINIDWEELRFKGEITEESKRPVEMTP